MRLVRSGGAGIIATLADVGSLYVMVSWLGIDAVPARPPAFVIGSIVMFLGNRYFVYGDGQARALGREIVLFSIVQGIGMVVTTLVYRSLLGISPLGREHYVLVNHAANFVVWLGYFFPAWHFVFREAPRPKPAVEAAGQTLGS